MSAACTGNGNGCDKPELAADRDKPSFENVLEILGMPGRYQMTQLALIFLSKLIVTFMSISYVFIGYDPPHVCNPVNETSFLLKHGIDPFNSTNGVKVLYKDACDVTIATSNNTENDGVSISSDDSTSCPNGRNFYTTEGRPTTYVSDWDLVCESTGLAEWSQTIFILGQIVGGVINAQLVDRLGRKPIFVFSSVSVFVLEGLVLVAPNIYVIYAIKFISGFFFQGVMTSYLVSGMELLLPRHRQIYGVLICVLWVFQLMVLGGVAYLLQDQDWRYLQGMIVACGAFSLLYPFFFNESPRWLAANDKKEKSLVIIKKACLQNKKDFVEVKAAFDAFMLAHHKTTGNDVMMMEYSNADDGLHEGKPDVAENISPSDVTVKTTTKPGGGKQTMLTLFRTRQLLFVTLTAFYIWLTCNMTYYGLYMTSSSIAGDRFLNYILMAVVEIPSNAAILFMMSRFSRRFVLMTFLALSAASLMTSSLFVTFVDGYTYVSTALFIFGKFAITCAFNTIFIYTPELFPTNLRGIGTGFCNSFGRCGSMIAPFLRPLYHVAPWAPGSIFTVMCLVAFFLIPFLPETKDKNLLNNIDELKTERKTNIKSIL